MSIQHQLHCQLSKIPDTSDTIQTGNLRNWNSCETDHGVVERRWMVIPKGCGERRGTGSRTWSMPRAAEPCAWPGDPTSTGGPARAWAEPSAPEPPLVEKNLLLTTTKEQEKWSECPDRLHPQSFPEGLTQTSLQASPFPPSWWKLLSRFLELAVRKYTPFLSTHLYIASFCNAASPSEAVSRWHQLNVVLKSEAEVLGLYLSEQAGSQMDARFAWPYCGVTTCTEKLQTNAVALWVSLFATMIPLLVPLRGCRGQALAARCTPAAAGTGHPSAPQAFPSSSVAGDVLLRKRPRCAPRLPGTQALVLVFDPQL